MHSNVDFLFCTLQCIIMNNNAKICTLIITLYVPRKRNDYSQYIKKETTIGVNGLSRELFSETVLKEVRKSFEKQRQRLKNCFSNSKNKKTASTTLVYGASQKKKKGNDISVGCVWAVWVMTNERTLRGIQVTFFGWLPFLCPPRGVISHCWEAPAHIFQMEEGSGWQNEWQHLISHVCTRWWALGLENLHGL